MLALIFFVHSAEAKSRKSKSAPQLRKETAINPENYPPELSGRIAAYNGELKKNKTLGRRDAELAKAKGGVLKIEKESFEVYASFIARIRPREAAKIRDAVSKNGWYKGMPQIAFVVSMGLPDDLEKIPTGNGNRLRLVYQSRSYYFEKGKLASVK